MSENLPLIRWIDIFLFLPNLLFFTIFIIRLIGRKTRFSVLPNIIYCVIIFIIVNILTINYGESALNRFLAFVGAVGGVLCIRGLGKGSIYLWYFIFFPYLPGLAVWAFVEETNNPSS